MKSSGTSEANRETDNRLIVLAPQDNVAVVREAISAGETVAVSGRQIVMADRVAAGHKIARQDIGKGDRILKYGAPIGSATCPIRIGDHVHLHNIKSDYTHTHSLDEARIRHEKNSRGRARDV
ncbi:MAG: UxaA family hydrolase [Alphaproteobacteria bacterium]|nr:UxaA family hydrolase [Alphaproteobacteria bacterium]